MFEMDCVDKNRFGQVCQLQLWVGAYYTVVTRKQWINCHEMCYSVVISKNYILTEHLH